ncbi:Tah1p Ecym_2090 [Eremothecium cymbalariae DBVPG|uniref:Uncharacterized protein n=1 Tax=Eremothecium cymbalariae (strain CBS 270.75 / DBVPG 7215 / KCTC 17166 / NRRL Y-17582) TaxID=931890 RepID=G8JPJ4_ERECY|nr:Hypothetical protein Ecym_2090 [Eremothecium cymbalariae DBVPG\
MLLKSKLKKKIVKLFIKYSYIYEYDAKVGRRIVLESMNETAEDLKVKGNTFFKNGDYETAILYYEKACALDSSNPIYFSNMATALIKLERWQEAVNACDKGLNKVSFKTGMDSKTKQKLEWRRITALKHLVPPSREQETTGKTRGLNTGNDSNRIKVHICDVDSLPIEFRDL